MLFHFNINVHNYVHIPEVGTRNFFSSPQSQLCNSKEALPQSQFRNFLKNVAPQPQLRNSAIAIFSEVRNSRALFPQFSADFWRGVAWNYIFFYRQVFFAVERILKGQQHKIFRFRKIGGQKSLATFPLRQFFVFHRNKCSKNITGCNLKPSWAEV